MRREPQGGFTLIEVLVALAITAFVAAAAYSGISGVLGGAEQLRASSVQNDELGRALALIDRDIRQFTPRAVRDEFGDAQPAISGGPLAWHLLSLTRAGWYNTQNLPRSDLQRVNYYLEDGALWRAYYPVLDRLSNTQRLEVRLLDDVEEFELRFLDSVEQLQVGRGGEIDTDNWPRNWVVDRSQPGAALPPPAAIELRLTVVDVGELRRLYVLPQS